MPAAPKLRDGAGLVGMLEVLQEAEAKEMTQADSHVGITREVEIDLEGIGQHAQPRHSGRGLGHGGDLLPQCAHLVGDQHLLGKTHHEALHTAAGLKHALAAVQQLMLHRLILDDRACNQLGEQRHECAESDNILLHRCVFAVDINGIAHRLEGVEANTNREWNPQ